MFGHKRARSHSAHSQQSTTSTNPYALAAARAITPQPRDNPTLSQHAAATALVSTAMQPTNPANVVTRRMERRNSQTSMQRRASDSSMTGRMGTFRSDNGNGNSIGGEGSRPVSRDGTSVVQTPMRPASRNTERMLSTMRPSSRNSDTMPMKTMRDVKGKTIAKQAPRQRPMSANMTASDYHRPMSPPLPVPAPSARTRKEQLQSSDGVEHQHFVPKKKKSKASIQPADQGVGMPKSMRSTTGSNVLDAATKPVKKKSATIAPQEEHSRLTTGTMRSTFAPPAPRASNGVGLSTMQERERQREASPLGVSDEARMMAREIMRKQMAAHDNAAPKKKKKKAVKKAVAVEKIEDLEPPPKIRDPAQGNRNYAGSISSINSFASDLESIPEERGPKGRARAKRPDRSSIIIPGQDGVPDLPSSPLLTKSFETEDRVRIQQNVLQGTPPATSDSNPNSATKTYFDTRDVPDQAMPEIHTIAATPPASANPEQTRFPGHSTSSVDEIDPSHVRKPSLSPSRSPSRAQFPSQSLDLSNRRHSPPPRSRSPAKSALKSSHMAQMSSDMSDHSSIMSTEDSHGNLSASGRKKLNRVSFSGQNSVVELDDEQYRYQPVSRNITDKGSPSRAHKGIGDVSFSSVGRTTEEAPKIEKTTQGISTDLRLSGSIGAELVNKLGEKKQTASTKDKITRTSAPVPATVKEVVLPATSPVLDSSGTSSNPSSTAISRLMERRRKLLQEPKQDGEESDSGESVYSDAYEDVDHIVLSPTGSGAVLGISTSHGTPAKADGATVADNVVLPSISEVVAEQTSTQGRKNGGKIALASAGGADLLPEEMLSDSNEQPKTTLPPAAKQLAKKSSKTAPAATKPKATRATSAGSPGTRNSTASVATGSQPPRSTKRPVSQVASQSKAVAAWKSQPAPILPRQDFIESDSEMSDSSFQRENPRRKAARGGGFSMRTTMRGGPASANPGTAPTMQTPVNTMMAKTNSIPAGDRGFSSGFRNSTGPPPRTGRSIGQSSGSRSRNYSPDSSDDERGKRVIPVKTKSSGSGFFGKGTLRGNAASAPAPAPVRKSAPVSGWQSKFVDSSDEEEDRVMPLPSHRPTSLSDLSSDEEMTTATSLANKRATAPPVMNGNLGHDNESVFSETNTTTKRKWWSLGSRKGKGASSRPTSSAGPAIAAPLPGRAMSFDTARPNIGARRGTDPEPTALPPRGTSLRKQRRDSSNSVTSVGSNQSWTPSSSTGIVANPVEAQKHARRMSGVPELDEDLAPRDELPETPITENTVSSEKKKKYQKLRKFFGIQD